VVPPACLEVVNVNVLGSSVDSNWLM
jgi:hypothetical protein